MIWTDGGVVAPAWGRGLKSEMSSHKQRGRQVAPAWGRGLKLGEVIAGAKISGRPRMGAWIEIKFRMG